MEASDQTKYHLGNIESFLKDYKCWWEIEGEKSLSSYMIRKKSRSTKFKIADEFGQGSFICKSCGRLWTEEKEPISFNYCPNCGRVISDVE